MHPMMAKGSKFVCTWFLWVIGLLRQGQSEFCQMFANFSLKSSDRKCSNPTELDSTSMDLDHLICLWTGFNKLSLRRIFLKKKLFKKNYILYLKFLFYLFFYHKIIYYIFMFIFIFFNLFIIINIDLPIHFNIIPNKCNSFFNCFSISTSSSNLFLKLMSNSLWYLIENDVKSFLLIKNLSNVSD